MHLQLSLNFQKKFKKQGKWQLLPLFFQLKVFNKLFHRLPQTVKLRRMSALRRVAQRQVIYKHAISTIVPIRPVELREMEEGSAL